MAEGWNWIRTNHYFRNRHSLCGQWYLHSDDWLTDGRYLTDDRKCPICRQRLEEEANEKRGEATTVSV